MTKKTRILIGCVSGFVIVFSLFHFGYFRKIQYDFAQFLNKIIIGDEMKITSSQGVDKSRIKINLAYSDKTVFEHNRFYDNIGEHYGGPVFDVYYDTILIGRALHGNTNDWCTNEYSFDFYQEVNRIKFKFKSNGRDSYGEVGYLWIEQSNDSLSFESFDLHGKWIHRWKEMMRLLSNIK